MEKFKTYKVVESYTIRELEDSINLLLLDDWVLIGGIHTGKFDLEYSNGEIKTKVIYLQSLAK